VGRGARPDAIPGIPGVSDVTAFYTFYLNVINFSNEKRGASHGHGLCMQQVIMTSADRAVELHTGCWFGPATSLRLPNISESSSGSLPLSPLFQRPQAFPPIVHARAATAPLVVLARAQPPAAACAR
jgi:hypothetical protein